ncbi:hypothetical protein GGR53DRAFT_277750 [Hypoxylon sp. FL1150]|nr:hypothetical protein GGR53DRAFT_277750 [Hypoxylon sp. FL1150]
MGKLGVSKAPTPYHSVDSDSDYYSSKLNDPSPIKNGSVRQRLMKSLSHTRSFPTWDQTQSSQGSSEVARKENISMLRRSLSSISSSLRRRLSSSGYPAGDETSDRRPSVIRKSFGSMSSSLRGIRSSMSSRRSQDIEERATGDHYHTISGALGRSSSRKYNSFGRLSSDPYHDSVPRLPALDEMIAKAQADKATPIIQSPNSLMGMFDTFDGPIGQSWHASLPIRLKDPTRLFVDCNGEAKALSEAVREAVRTPECPSDASTQTTDDQRGLRSSKVPVGWIDRILETSAPTRDRVVPTGSSLAPPVPSASGQRVNVNVPDEKDHSKPWPRRSYRDMKSALAAVCGRLRPFYAPFAAYSDRTHTLHLFPPAFGAHHRPDSIPHLIFFNMQEILDTWNLLEAEAKRSQSKPRPAWDSDAFEASDPSDWAFSDSDRESPSYRIFPPSGTPWEEDDDDGAEEELEGSTITEAGSSTKSLLLKSEFNLSHESLQKESDSVSESGLVL